MFLHFNRAPLLLLSGKNKNPKIEHVRIKMCSNFFIFSHVQTYRCCFSPWFRSPRARSLCEPANCNTVSRIQQEGKEKAGKHFHVFCSLSLLFFISSFTVCALASNGFPSILLRFIFRRLLATSLPPPSSLSHTFLFHSNAAATPHSLPFSTPRRTPPLHALLVKQKLDLLLNYF
jgi:hypothetical protein